MIRSNFFKKSASIAVSALFAGSLLSSNAFSQDPNFYIFLAFGQSNMDGAGAIEAQDKTGISDRFRVMYPADNDAGRTKGKWATAIPPLCRSTTKLCPADYFGRTLIDSLPSNIKIGIINVSIPGTKIEVFVKESYQSYLSGLSSQDKYIKDYANNSYGGNPYGRLVEMGKLAQKDGVIKGFLLHQGESNPNDAQWVKKVKSIYDNFLTEFSLKASETPLLAGELLYTNKGGACGAFNTYINSLHDAIPNAHAISADGLTGVDQYHFTSASYRTFGKRYADTMLTILRKQSTGVIARNNLTVKNYKNTAITSLYSIDGKKIPAGSVQNLTAGKKHCVYVMQTLGKQASLVVKPE
ncbi:MAG: sialate O-acetylesterase [Fibrobacter sp.]|nr:sialate O-acetylesterase [Fibrobacter sp.]